MTLISQANDLGKRDEKPVFFTSYYMKTPKIGWRREEKEKTVRRETQSLYAGSASVKGLWPDPPTPKLGEMSKIKGIWEQRATWSCILGERKEASRLTASLLATITREQQNCVGVRETSQRQPLCSGHPTESLKEPRGFFRPQRQGV